MRLRQLRYHTNMFKLRRAWTRTTSILPSEEPPPYATDLPVSVVSLTSSVPSPSNLLRLVKDEVDGYAGPARASVESASYGGCALLNCDLLRIHSQGSTTAIGGWVLVTHYRVHAHNLTSVGVIEDKVGVRNDCRYRFIDVVATSGEVTVRVVVEDDFPPKVILGRHISGTVGQITLRDDDYSLAIGKNNQLYEFARVATTNGHHQLAVTMVDAEGYRGPSVANIGCMAPGDCLVNTARMSYRFRAVILGFVAWQLGLMTATSKMHSLPIPTLGWERDEQPGERISGDISADFAVVTPGEIYDYFHLDTAMMTSSRIKLFELPPLLWCHGGTSQWTVLSQYGIVDGAGTPVGYMAQLENEHHLLHDYHDDQGRLVMRVVAQAPTTEVFLPVVTAYGDHKFERVGSMMEEPDGRRRYLLFYEGKEYGSGSPSVVLAKPFKSMQPRWFGRVEISCEITHGHRSHSFTFHGQLAQQRAALVGSLMLMDHLKRTRLKRLLLA